MGVETVLKETAPVSCRKRLTRFEMKLAHISKNALDNLHGAIEQNTSL